MQNTDIAILSGGMVGLALTQPIRVEGLAWSEPLFLRTAQALVPGLRKEHLIPSHKGGI